MPRYRLVLHTTILALAMRTGTGWSLTASDAAWVGSWASSPQLVEPQNRPPQPGLAGNTLRQFVRLTAGGEAIRLRLSNEFGTQR